MFIDKTQEDSNDTIFNADRKWRCVVHNSRYIQVSSLGYSSKSTHILDKDFQNLSTCLYDLFKTKVFVVYNPCIIISESAPECKNIPLLLNQTDVI
jgi:hypothetical protein